MSLGCFISAGLCGACFAGVLVVNSIIVETRMWAIDGLAAVFLFGIIYFLVNAVRLRREGAAKLADL